MNNCRIPRGAVVPTVNLAGERRATNFPLDPQNAFAGDPRTVAT